MVYADFTLTDFALSIVRFQMFLNLVGIRYIIIVRLFLLLTTRAYSSLTYLHKSLFISDLRPKPSSQWSQNVLKELVFHYCSHSTYSIMATLNRTFLFVHCLGTVLSGGISHPPTALHNPVFWTRCAGRPAPRVLRTRTFPANWQGTKRTAHNTFTTTINTLCPLHTRVPVAVVVKSAVCGHYRLTDWMFKSKYKRTFRLGLMLSLCLCHTISEPKQHKFDSSDFLDYSKNSSLGLFWLYIIYISKTLKKIQN